MRVEPNIYKTTGGRYKARYWDPAGNPRYKTFDRLTDARRYLREMNARVARSEWIDPTLAKRTYAEAVGLWRATWVDLKPTTQARYVGILDNYVLRAFGKRAIGSITKGAVQAYVKQLVDDPDVAPATVWRIVDVIRGPFKAAIEAGWLLRNPASG